MRDFTHRAGFLSVVALVLAALTSVSRAEAQQGAAAHHYEPTAPGQQFRAIPSATVRGDGEPWVGLSWDYAYKPRGLSNRDEGNGLWGSAQVFSHLAASLVMWDRACFDLNLPMRLASTEALSDQGGFQFADPRLGSRVGVSKLSPSMNLGAEMHVWVPIGSESEATGDGKARVDARGIVDGKYNNIAFSSYLGALFRKKADVGRLTVGPAVTFGAAAAIALMDQRAYVGPEIFGHIVIPSDDINTGFSRSMPIEGLATLRFQIGSFRLGGLLGTGLTTTPGTARMRFELSVATIAPLQKQEMDTDADNIVDDKDACPRTPGFFHPNPQKHGCPLPPPPPADQDGDNIIDEQDACVRKAGVTHPTPKRNGCPSDADDDGIIDAKDACPQVPGVSNSVPQKHGCPPDADEDGIVDVQDACVDTPGVPNKDPQRHGCPPDSDNDGIVDAQDACPLAAGEPSEDPQKHGCPLAAIVVDEIKITQKVHFRSRSAQILPESHELLAAIVKLLQDHPEVLKVSIEGHTDSRDNPFYNRQLSKWRAASVRRWLIQKGIEPGRLVSTGFGEDRPIADNTTEEGMASNRRVEFHIKQRANPPSERADPSATPKAPETTEAPIESP